MTKSFWLGRTFWEKKKYQKNKEEESDQEGAENGSIPRLEACRVMRQRSCLERIMKGEGFGYSGGCHDLDLDCSSGLPFPHSHESGNPGSMNSKMDTRHLPPE